MHHRAKMHISSEDIKSILVQNGFEIQGDVLVLRGPTEFMATVVNNRVDLSYNSGPARGSYSLEVFSPDFISTLGHIFADARTKARIAMQHWR